MSKSSLDRFHPFDLAFKNLPEGGYSLILMISRHITALEIQRDRIVQSIDILSAKPYLTETENVYDRLLVDINFYILAWANIGKSLKKLSLLMHDAHLTWVLERRKKWFEQIRQARNSLEHMDARIVASSPEPFILDLIRIVGYSSNIIIICGTRIDVSPTSFKRIDALTTDLQRWLSKVPSKM